MSKNKVIALLLVFSFPCFAERLIVLHGGEIKGDHHRGLRAINIAETNAVRSAYESRLDLDFRRYPHPSLLRIDGEDYLWVRKTSTWTQARSDLRQLYRDRYPKKTQLEQALSSGRIEDRREALRQDLAAAQDMRDLKQSIWALFQLTHKVADALIEQSGENLESTDD